MDSFNQILITFINLKYYREPIYIHTTENESCNYRIKKIK